MRPTISKTESGGYTIIETMIATSLFIIVVMAGMGALLNANRVHQKSQDMRSIIDNLSFAMEEMSRNLRTGYRYQCFEKGVGVDIIQGNLGTTASCPDGGAIAFESGEGDSTDLTDQWVYYLDLDGGKLYKSAEGAQLGTFYQLTPDEVVLDNASGFSVLGAEPPAEGGGGDRQQPLVTIRLVGTITSKGVVTPFSLQTSASHRLIDI